MMTPRNVSGHVCRCKPTRNHTCSINLAQLLLSSALKEKARETHQYLSLHCFKLSPYPPLLPLLLKNKKIKDIFKETD